MSNKVPLFIKEQILEMPEYKQGANKVRVTLRNGDRYSAVLVAWAEEIIRVGSSAMIPFNAEEIIEVENDL